MFKLKSGDGLVSLSNNESSECMVVGDKGAEYKVVTD